MGEIVNLRRARKRQASAQDQIKAAASRVDSGVSKKVRARAEAERVLAQRRLDAHRKQERGDAD
jgi:hypothetical protein